MTSDQIAEAQRRAREMVEANPKLLGELRRISVTVILKIGQKLRVYPRFRRFVYSSLGFCKRLGQSELKPNNTY